MRFDPITGNEVQVGSGQLAIHAGDSIDDKVEEILKKVEKAFEGETAHKIVRLSHLTGASTFFTNAGYEKQLYNDITDYVTKVSQTNPNPIVIYFIAFVSYSPLREVNSDNVEA